MPRRKAAKKAAEKEGAPIQQDNGKGEAHRKEPAVAVVCGPKGGVGKSTLTRQLGVAAALDGVNVALVDLDKQRTVTKWFSRRPDGMCDIPIYTAEMSDAGDVLSMRNHDLLIIDTPPGIEAYPDDVNRLVNGASLIIVPCGPSSDETESVTAWVGSIQRLNRPVLFVLTRAQRNTVSFKKARGELIRSAPLCSFEIPQSEDIKRANEIGLSVQEIKNGFGTDEVLGVWQQIRRELQLATKG